MYCHNDRVYRAHLILIAGWLYNVNIVNRIHSFDVSQHCSTCVDKEV